MRSIPQKQLQSCLADLRLCWSLVGHLGVLSPNETLDDINTRDLRCILVDGLSGEMLLLLKTTSGKERIANLEQATVSPRRQGLPNTSASAATRARADHLRRGGQSTTQERFRKYIELVERYEVVPEGQRGVFAGPQQASQDPAKRRESKIAQFKMERQIKSTLEVGQSHSRTASSGGTTLTDHLASRRSSARARQPAARAPPHPPRPRPRPRPPPTRSTLTRTRTTSSTTRTTTTRRCPDRCS